MLISSIIFQLFQILTQAQSMVFISYMVVAESIKSLIRIIINISLQSDLISKLYYQLNHMKSLIKIFTGLGALLIMLIGFALLGITIYGFINSSLFLGDQSLKWAILGTLLAVSLLIILGTIIGLAGLFKEQPQLICCFQIIVIIFIMVFLGLGVGLIFVPQIFFDGDCRTSSTGVIQEAYRIYSTSNETFCKSECACTLTNDSSILMNTYNISQIKYIQDNYIYNPTGARSTKDCTNNQLTPAQITLFTTLGQLENLLSCSMWCQSQDYNLIYRFRDVSNSGKPQKFCYEAFKKANEDYNYYAKLGSFTAGGILLLMFVCNMYLCCSSQRRNQTLRERFLIIVQSQGSQDGSAYNYSLQENKNSRK